MATTAAPRGAKAAAAKATRKKPDPDAVGEGTSQTEAVLVHLDPRVLAEHPANSNVRDEAGDVSALADSIREVGVIQALTVEVDGDGYRLIAGRRRCAAAIEAGVARVPCLARPAPDGKRKAGELPAMQVAENDERRALTTGERIRAMEQMSLGGMSQARIAKATGHKPADVRRHLAVARSEVASTVASRYDLSLEQAAALVEFEDDREAIKTLTVTAQHNPQYFDHTLSGLRRMRDDAKRHAEQIDRYRHDHPGVEVIADYEDVPHSAARLGELRSPDGARLDPEEHEACPGHLMAPHPYEFGLTAFCKDPGTHGHTKPAGPGGKPSTVDGHMTEEALAERREVIANNRAWLAATEVRLRWIRELLQRKTAPKAAMRLVATEILVRPGTLSYGTEETMLDMLGVTRSTDSRFYARDAAKAVVDDASENRLLVAALAQVAATHEDTMDKGTWRHVNADAARWLRFLATTGYTLAAVEQLVVDKVDTADAAEAAEEAEEAAAAGDDDAGSEEQG